MTCDDLMGDEEFGRILAEHGPTYAAWEWADRWLRAWREAHDEDDRDDLALVLSDDYPHGLDHPGGPAIGAGVRS